MHCIRIKKSHVKTTFFHFNLLYPSHPSTPILIFSLGEFLTIKLYNKKLLGWPKTKPKHLKVIISHEPISVIRFMNMSNGLQCVKLASPFFLGGGGVKGIGSKDKKRRLPHDN